MVEVRVDPALTCGPRSEFGLTPIPATRNGVNPYLPRLGFRLTPTLTCGPGLGFGLTSTPTCGPPKCATESWDWARVHPNLRFRLGFRFGLTRTKKLGLGLGLNPNPNEVKVGVHPNPQPRVQVIGPPPSLDPAPRVTTWVQLHML